MNIYNWFCKTSFLEWEGYEICWKVKERWRINPANSLHYSEGRSCKITVQNCHTANDTAMWQVKGKEDFKDKRQLQSLSFLNLRNNWPVLYLVQESKCWNLTEVCGPQHYFFSLVRNTSVKKTFYVLIERNTTWDCHGGEYFFQPKILWYKDQYIENCQSSHVWTIKNTNELFIWEKFELFYNFTLINLIRFNWPWYVIDRTQNPRLTEYWIISIYLEAAPLVYLCTLCHKYIHTLS